MTIACALLNDPFSEAAVANFFVPTSQKPSVASLVNWSERSVDDDTPPTLLVGRYEKLNGAEEPSLKRRKIAAFDLDGTLIKTASGKQFSDDPLDWRWWHPKVPSELQTLYEKGYRVVIFSNQAGITLRPDPKTKAPKTSKRLPAWKQKLNAVLAQLDIPTSVYGATGQDIFRKPRTGMWKELCEDHDLAENDVDKDESFFIGDAGGRVVERAGEVKDFSCSDRNFAHNIGITYKTPEEYFLDEKARKFQRDLDFSIQSHLPQTRQDRSDLFQRQNDKEIVLFCGSPGAGKSSFYRANLEPLGYKRVNQDTLKSREKCIKVAQEHLEKGESVCIDNTNADVETRAHWISLANKHQVPIRCIWFKTQPAVAEHNNAVRAMNKQLNFEARELVPKIAFKSYDKRFKEPQKSEGFAEVIQQEFIFNGTKEAHDIWTKYWV